MSITDHRKNFTLLTNPIHIKLKLKYETFTHSLSSLQAFSTKTLLTFQKKYTSTVNELTFYTAFKNNNSYHEEIHLQVLVKRSKYFWYEQVCHFYCKVKYSCLFVLCDTISYDYRKKDLRIYKAISLRSGDCLTC